MEQFVMNQKAVRFGNKEPSAPNQRTVRFGSRQTVIPVQFGSGEPSCQFGSLTEPNHEQSYYQVEGFKMNLIYYDLYQATRLEKFVTASAEFLKANGETPVTWKRAATMDEVLQEADLISLHPVLDKTTYHLVNKERLAKMKKEAILINCSRGPVIDEAALVEHLRHNPMFRVGLDVFEDEPYMKPGLAELKNAIVVPHIASTSKWTHEGMATLAALNVLGKIKGYPVWFDGNRMEPFLNENAQTRIVNAKAIGLPVSKL